MNSIQKGDFGNGLQGLYFSKKNELLICQKGSKRSQKSRDNCSVAIQVILLNLH